jgi:hypothetical protein
MPCVVFFFLLNATISLKKMSLDTKGVNQRME